ncbi:MAG: AAA family ATPase [SAR86 cluster bacterium]|uniref:AAA family ATPase n=1 Tax=SAR86 cluster bacterium TaxID=2030880 RepID=A0A838XYG4_9GAMM|nr:AAA family ATPase [SAR86 cluster bacterium]
MNRPNSENPGPAFDDTLEDILELLEEDTQHFIYLTGAAGTGKTTLIERVKDESLLKKMVVAPTGVAALNIGGSTINSAFRIGFDTFPVIQESKDPRFKKLLKNLELLIIDEISMVRAPMLDAISETLQIHRNSSKPFGGIHVLACGDLFQLPPVVKENEESAIFERYGSVYFFSADNFKAIEKPIFFELVSSFRQQDDKEFYNLLNNVRLGKNLESSINMINKTCHNPEFDTESSLIITSRKYRAEQINDEMLSRIDGPMTAAKSKEQGELNENDLPAPRELRVKEDAKVMFIKNDPDGRWVNGTIGVVIDCSDKNKKVIKVKVDKEVFKVKREEWNKVRYVYDEYNDEMEEEVISSFKQFPLKLGWAVTIHKAQGLTLDSCSVDLGEGAFATGQAYVALSRCKTLDSLNLYRELKVQDALVDPDIQDFHAEHFG